MSILASAAGLVAITLQAIPAQPGVPGLQPSPSGSPTPIPFGVGVFSSSFILSTIVWVPVLAALAVAVLPNPRGRYGRYLQLIAFWVNAFLLGLAIIGYSQFSLFATGPQYEEKLPWMPAFGVTYHLGVDGIQMTLLLMSQLIGVISVVASSGVRERQRSYYVLLLLAQTAVNGFIVAQDAFVMVLFWSAAAVPLALLVAGWGGPRRIPAAWRLLAYWTLGSFFLLAAVLLLYGATGGAAFDLTTFTKAGLSPRVQVIAGALLVLAACTRLPLFPFQGWVRDAFAEAPVGVSVLIAGMASRLGGVLLLEVLVAGLHDGAKLLGPFIAAIAVVTAVYAAVAAMRGADIRVRGAYLALVPGAVTALGISALTPLSLIGTVLSLWAGGFAAALIVGACAVVSERGQSRNLDLLAGLAPRMPKLAWLFVIAGLAVLGIPGLASFPADLMTLFGSFRTQPAGAFGVTAGLVLTGIAVAWLLGRVLFGPPSPDTPAASDASLAEVWFLGLLAGALLWVGIVPGGPKLAGVPLFLDPGVVNVMNASVGDLAAPYVSAGPSATAGTSP
jgi:NADH-quinone oxidoreductase subunit M